MFPCKTRYFRRRTCELKSIGNWRYFEEICRRIELKPKQTDEEQEFIVFFNKLKHIMMS
jgi:hypothetical protein